MRASAQAMCLYSQQRILICKLYAVYLTAKVTDNIVHVAKALKSLLETASDLIKLHLACLCVQYYPCCMRSLRPPAWLLQGLLLHICHEPSVRVVRASD